MADGDDRDENSQETQRSDDTGVLDLGNLQIDDLQDSDNLEAVLSEYLTLDGQLNQLDACLDSFEARNDDLVTKMKAFLQAGQAQVEPQVQNGETGNNGSSVNGGEAPSNSDSSRNPDSIHAKSSASGS